ncbi:MAG: tetratricopeptide repeat protein [Acidobacteriaceae bacterium]
MSAPSKVMLWVLLAALCAAGSVWAQSGVQPSELGQHYKAAESFQQKGDLASAAREYREFLADALGDLAAGEALAGDYAKAAPLFDGALEMEPDSGKLRTEYLRAALAGGDFEHAETLARQLIEEDAGHPKELAEAHELLGRTLLKLDRDPEARRELEAAVALDPSFDNGYNLAVACLDLDDERCADRIFSQMEAVDGDTPALHMQLGRAWAESDFQPRAEAEFRKAIAEDPHYPEAHYCLAATYLEENDPSKVTAAEKELRLELTVSPRDFLTWAALGKLAVTQERYADAAKDLHEAIALNPRSPDAYLYLGQMEYNRSQFLGAKADLQKAIALTTDPSRNRYQIQKAYYLLGRILMREGKETEAAAEMKIAQAYLQHDLSQDKTRLSGFLEQAGQGMGGSGMGRTGTTLAMGSGAAGKPTGFDAANAKKLEDFQKQIAPAIADSYNNLGDIAAKNKDFAVAAGYFQSAAQWNPTLPGLDLNWGRAAFTASRFGDAVIPLTRYVQAHPEDKNIRAALGISQYMIRDYRDSMQTLAPIAGQMDDVPQVAFVYADSMVKTGQTAAGIERLTEIEKAHPEIPDVHRALGEAYAARGEKQKAAEEFEQAKNASAAAPH